MNTPNETTKSSRNVYITVILLTAMVVSFAVAGIAMAPVLAEQAREDEAAKIIEDKENAEEKAAEDKKKAAEEKAEDEKKAAEKAAEEEKKAEEKANEEKAAEEEKEAEEEAEKAAEEKKAEEEAAEEEAERANITTPAEAFCNGLESDLTVMNLMVGRVDSGELTYEEAAYQAHSYAGNSCPDWLDPSLADDDYRKAFIGYLQGWNVIPGDIWAGV